MSANAPCTCPRIDGYRIKRRGCPAHAEKDGDYWRSQDAPVPDDEAAKRFRDAAASLRSAQIHWPADCLMEAATMAEAHARAVRDAERALAERIAKAIEARIQSAPEYMSGPEVGLKIAANIAREAVAVR